MADFGGAASNFLTKTFEITDNAIGDFAQNFSAGIASDIAPLVAGFLTLTFMIMGIMAVYGFLEQPFKEVAWKLFTASVIVSIALTSAAYQSYVVNVLLSLPDDIMVSVSSYSGGISTNGTGQSAAKSIEGLFTLGMQNVSLFYEEGSFKLRDLNIPPFIYGTLLLAGVLLCVIYGAVALFVAKIVLSLMVGVGPIFICCLIWQSTRQYFWSWIAQILNVTLTVVFVLAVFSIFSIIFENNLAALDVEQESENLVNTASFLFLGMLCIAVLTQIPVYVSGLTGAAGGAVGSAMAKIGLGAALGVAGAAGAAGSVLKGGIRAGFAGKAAAQRYGKSRQEGGSRFSSARDARHEFNQSNKEMKQGYPDYYRQTKGMPNDKQ